MLRQKFKISFKLKGLYGIHLIRCVFRFGLGLLVEFDIRVGGSLVAAVCFSLFFSGTGALLPVTFSLVSDSTVVTDVIVVGFIGAIAVVFVIGAIL